MWTQSTKPLDRSLNYRGLRPPYEIMRVFTLKDGTPNDGTAWQEVAGSLGMQIDGSQFSYVEFR